MVEYALLTAGVALHALAMRATLFVESVNWVMVLAVAAGLVVTWQVLKPRA
jgi:hypothetical protein